MAQIRSLTMLITFGSNVSEVDLVMSNLIFESTAIFHSRIETQTLMIPIVGDEFRYRFDTTLLRWDTIDYSFDYE